MFPIVGVFVVVGKLKPHLDKAKAFDIFLERPVRGNKGISFIARQCSEEFMRTVADYKPRSVPWCEADLAGRYGNHVFHWLI